MCTKICFAMISILENSPYINPSFPPFLHHPSPMSPSSSMRILPLIIHLLSFINIDLHQSHPQFFRCCFLPPPPSRHPSIHQCMFYLHFHLFSHSSSFCPFLHSSIPVVVVYSLLPWEGGGGGEEESVFTIL